MPPWRQLWGERSPRRRQESERGRDAEVAVLALLAIASLVLPAACNRRALVEEDAGGTGRVGIEAGVDTALTSGADVAARDGRANEDAADVDAGATIPCGPSLTCTGTDLCLTVNLCGGPLRCDDLADGGQCPPGSTLNPDCPGGR